MQRVRPVFPARPVLQAFPDRWAPKGTLVRKDRRVPKATLVRKDQRASKATRVRKDQPAPKATPVRKGWRDQRDSKALPDLKVRAA